MAKAAIDGIDPYLPVATLYDRYIPSGVSVTVFPHPSPHPPFAVILGYLLVGLPADVAPVVWLAIELLLVVVVSGLLVVPYRHTSKFIPLMAGLLCSWSPLWDELIAGQLMLLLLVLLLGLWLALRDEHYVLAGILLGVAVALKLVLWPFFAFLFLKRHWKALISAITTCAGLNVAAGVVIGFGRVMTYYLDVGQMVATFYRHQAYNYSVMSLGWRLFEGTTSPFYVLMTCPPLFANPMLARVVAYGMVGLVFLGGLVMSMRLRNLDLAVAAMTCVCTLISPIAWSHYFVLLIFPIAVIFRRVWKLGFPVVSTNVVVLCTIVLSVPNAAWQQVVLLAAGQSASVGQSPEIGVAVSLVTYLPTLAVIGIAAAIPGIDRGCAAMASPDVNSLAKDLVA